MSAGLFGSENDEANRQDDAALVGAVLKAGDHQARRRGPGDRRGLAGRASPTSRGRARSRRRPGSANSRATRARNGTRAPPRSATPPRPRSRPSAGAPRHAGSRPRRSTRPWPAKAPRRATATAGQQGGKGMSGHRGSPRSYALMVQREAPMIAPPGASTSTATSCPAAASSSRVSGAPFHWPTERIERTMLDSVSVRPLFSPRPTAVRCSGSKPMSRIWPLPLPAPTMIDTRPPCRLT